LKQLYRSTNNKIIGGVAGGIAEYVDLDVTLVRLIWVLSFFAGGIFVYLICWIIFPEAAENEDPSGPYTAPSDQEQDVSQQRLTCRRNLGLILIALGLVFLVKNMVPWYLWEKAWPLLLVVIGLYILFSNRKGDQL
jgi:phage shock protein PspC (stress-responsive transcriptional regulator)